MTLEFPRYVARLDLAIEVFRQAQRHSGDAVVALVADQLCREAESVVAAWRLEHGDVRSTKG